MSKRKSFTAPLWVMGILVVATIYSLVGEAALQSELERFSTSDALQTRNYAMDRIGMILLALLIEVVIYWRFRYFITRKGLAWAHLLLAVAAIIVLPVISSEVSRNILEHNDGIVRRERSILWMNVSEGLFWALMILAHVFFIALVRHASKEKAKASQEPADDSKDILDDYAA